MRVLRRFCTYFDSNYLVRGLALYRSLARHCPGFELWVLGLDQAASRTLQNLGLPGLRLLTLEELEEAHPGLAEARRSRSRVEYYFTCTPSLLLHLLACAPEGESLTYLDADLYFFADLSPVAREFGDDSILIVPHRFPPPLRRLEEHGVYNVGLMSFARDPNARECLEWWRDRCLEWCYDRVEPGKFADQKYLDDWPARFKRVRVLEHLGTGAAPWNVAAHPIQHRDGEVWIGADPLIVYHFHALKRLNRWIYDSGLAAYRASMTPVLKKHVYAPYLRELEDLQRWLRGAAPEFTPGWGSARRDLRGHLRMARGLIRGSLLISDHATLP